MVEGWPGGAGGNRESYHRASIGYARAVPEPNPESWAEIKAWRKACREALIARRMALDPAERTRIQAAIVPRLSALLEAARPAVLGLYWPIRGEIDLRPLAREHVAAGGTVALPVVVRSAAPVEFWRWRPGVAMRRGLWDIPVPPERDPLAPNLLIVPLVGFDGARYRLGYGGGFYDRTLAAAVPRPRAIGVGHAAAELPTIYPQSHDIAMSAIVTDQFAWGV
jgi:5-formyltetrahydrofolate cyclo-ligase